MLCNEDDEWLYESWRLTLGIGCLRESNAQYLLYPYCYLTPHIAIWTRVCDDMRKEPRLSTQ